MPCTSLFRHHQRKIEACLHYTSLFSLPLWGLHYFPPETLSGFRKSWPPTTNYLSPTPSNPLVFRQLGEEGRLDWFLSRLLPLPSSKGKVWKNKIKLQPYLGLEPVTWLLLLVMYGYITPTSRYVLFSWMETNSLEMHSWTRGKREDMDNSSESGPRAIISRLSCTHGVLRQQLCECLPGKHP